MLHYNCCPEPYPDVTFYLTLRRKPKFYQNSLFVPSALITVMAVLGYHLPVESGEKVSLQITVMLSLAVFQQLVSDKLPPSADSTPLIGTNATNNKTQTLRTTKPLIQLQHTTYTKYRIQLNNTDNYKITSTNGRKTYETLYIKVKGIFGEFGVKF